MLKITITKKGFDVRFKASFKFGQEDDQTNSQDHDLKTSPGLCSSFFPFVKANIQNYDKTNLWVFKGVD